MGEQVSIANIISAIRILLVPVVLVLAWRGASEAFLICLIFSLVSDIADGTIARRLGQVTELGAKLDSWGDLLTYVALLPCACWLRPEFVRGEIVYLIIVAASYLIPIAFGFIKYGQLTSYHTRLATVAAYVLGASIVVIFAGGPTFAFRIATLFILLAEIEEVAITAVLPTWQANVPSLDHVLRRAR